MPYLLATLCSYLYTHKTAAAVVGAAVPALPAMAFDSDPLPWMIGGGGGVFVYLMRDPVSHKRAAGGVMFSIILGGLAAPAMALTAIEYWNLSKNTGLQYLIAVFLGWGWPWLLEDGFPIIKNFFGGKRSD